MILAWLFFATFHEQDIVSTLLTDLLHQFGLHDRPWSSLCFSSGWTLEVNACLARLAQS